MSFRYIYAEHSRMIVASCHDSGSQSRRIYIFRSYKVSSFSEHQTNRGFLRNAEENHKIPIGKSSSTILREIVAKQPQQSG